MADMVDGKIATIRPSWHGKDNILTLEESRDTEVVIEKGNLGFEIHTAPIVYETSDGPRIYNGQFVAYHSNTGRALGVVSKQWKPVQPRQCVEFYKDLVDHFNWQLESAGALKHGALYWCLANNGLTGTVGKNDHVNARVYIASGIDMPTIVDHTGVFIVCWNTLSAAVRASNKSNTAARVVHRSVFDAEAVKKQLGLINYQEELNELIEIGNEAAKIKVSDTWAKEYFAKIVSGKDLPFDTDGELLNPRLVKKLEGYRKDSPGSSLSERENTLWGAINAVTYWTDHIRGHNDDNRGSGLLYGNSRLVKRRAVELAVEHMEAA